MTRASATDPPVLDPRLTNSVGLSQIATLTYNRLLRYPFADEAKNNADLTLKGDLAEAWQGSADFKTWTFKLRQGVKWHNVPPLNGRELVAEDIKYCYEAYAKEGVQSFTFQEIDGMETPDKYTIRVQLNGLPTASPKKWTCDPPMHRAFSRRQAFETHANRLALIPQVHRAQPVDHRRQQALIRNGQTGGVHPIDDLGVRLHPRTAPRKEDVQKTVQAHLHGEGPHEPGHERRQRVLKQ